jgi:hypothetical protein
MLLSFERQVFLLAMNASVAKPDANDLPSNVGTNVKQRSQNQTPVADES